MIDIFTSEDMENISLYIFQYLTAYYIIKADIFGEAVKLKTNQTLIKKSRAILGT